MRTDSAELSSSWESTIRSPTQSLQNILPNLKVHWRDLKNPALVPVLRQTNPAHTTPSFFSKINFNISLLIMSMSSSWSISFWLSHQIPVPVPVPFPYTCYGGGVFEHTGPGQEFGPHCKLRQATEDWKIRGGRSTPNWGKRYCHLLGYHVV
jgi:hypothetical protein